LPLDPLSREDGLRLVAQEGVVGSAVGELYRLTRGLPLALRVAAGGSAGVAEP
jgi:hypothetical protein